MNAHTTTAPVFLSLVSEAITSHRVKTAIVDVQMLLTMTTAPAYVSIILAVTFMCTKILLLIKKQ